MAVLPRISLKLRGRGTALNLNCVFLGLPVDRGSRLSTDELVVIDHGHGFFLEVWTFTTPDVGIAVLVSLLKRFVVL